MWTSNSCDDAYMNTNSLMVCPQLMLPRNFPTWKFDTHHFGLHSKLLSFPSNMFSWQPGSVDNQEATGSAPVLLAETSTTGWTSTRRWGPGATWDIKISCHDIGLHGYVTYAYMIYHLMWIWRVQVNMSSEICCTVYHACWLSCTLWLPLVHVLWMYTGLQSIRIYSGFATAVGSWASRSDLAHPPNMSYLRWWGQGRHAWHFTSSFLQRGVYVTWGGRTNYVHIDLHCMQVHVWRCVYYVFVHVICKSICVWWTYIYIYIYVRTKRTIKNHMHFPRIPRPKAVKNRPSDFSALCSSASCVAVRPQDTRDDCPSGSASQNAPGCFGVVLPIKNQSFGTNFSLLKKAVVSGSWVHFLKAKW